MIRRAAFQHAGWADTTSYEAPNLVQALSRMEHRDDVLGMCLAAGRPSSEMAAWARMTGPMPEEEKDFKDWVGVAERGMSEVASLLRKERVLR